MCLRYDFIGIPCIEFDPRGRHEAKFNFEEMRYKNFTTKNKVTEVYFLFDSLPLPFIWKCQQFLSFHKERSRVIFTVPISKCHRSDKMDYRGRNMTLVHPWRRIVTRKIPQREYDDGQKISLLHTTLYTISHFNTSGLPLKTSCGGLHAQLTKSKF